MDPAAADAILNTLTPAELAKAKAYTLGNHWLMVGNFLVDLLAAWLVLRAGWLVTLRARLERARSRPNVAAFAVGGAYFVATWLLTLPWSIWSDWKREHDYGRSEQPFADWLGQGGLALAVSAVLGGLFVAGMYALVRRTPRTWWLWGSGLAAATIGLLLLIGPVFIAPMFNRYTPLPDGPVKAALEELKTKAGVSDAPLVVFDGSRQSKNFTANVSGLAGSARIALSDVALTSASLPEVRAVTGHEIGHYVLGHVWRTVLVFSALAAVGFWLARRWFAPACRLLGARGVEGVADPAGLPVVLVALSAYLLLVTPLVNANTRRGEIEADNYSLNLAREPDALATSLVKTAEYRDPYPSRLQEILFYTHPSVNWRVRNAMTWKADHAAP